MNTLKMSSKRKGFLFHDAIVEEETYRIVSEAIDKLPDQMKAIMQLALEGKKCRNSRQTKHIYRNSPYIKENSLQETQRELERLLLLPLVLYIKRH